MIITRTPFRISFFGGGTDYPEWFQEHGGAVLGTSIDKYCYITLHKTPSYFSHKYKIVYSQFQYAQTIAEIEHPAVRGCLSYLGVKDGLEIYHHADLPAKKGLGASSAFVVGLLKALTLYNSRFLDSSGSNEDIAVYATTAQTQWIKENIGYQDQVLTAIGGFHIIHFEDVGVIPRVEPTWIAPHLLVKLEDSVMLFDTGISRIASDIAKEQIKSIPNKEAELTRMYEMVFEGLGYAELGDIERFGKLLGESWQIKRTLSDKITNPTIDAIYESGIKAGAYGGKLLGAGAGGFILFIVSPEKQESVKSMLKGLTYVPFRFENEGSKIIYQDNS